MTMLALYDRLKQRFALHDFMQRREDLAFVTAEQDQLHALLHHLQRREGFTHLVLLTAVDWIEQGQFQLTYLLCNRAQRQDLGLRVLLPRDAASMESIDELWPTAATYQRELHEMFGIDFPGSPGVDEPFILEGWNDIPPYRRDFDTLQYAQQTFRDRPGRETRDPALHMKKALYGGED
jgi:NADH-quinone oxidoreductase subunit C